MNEDKYPDSGRRRFVKGVVSSAALGGVGTAGAGALNLTTSAVGTGGGRTEYYAVENTDGPAPRGMPQIPVEIDDDGYLKGRWPDVEEVERDDGSTYKRAAEDIEYGDRTITYSTRWFQYCGIQTHSGIQPENDQDDYFRYTNATKYDWQQSAVGGGEKVNVEDFADYEEWGNGIGKAGLGKPAKATWRSQPIQVDGEQQEVKTNPVLLIRSPVIERKAEENAWLAESTAKGFIAVLNKCTHFCCVPGFKTSSGAKKFGGEDAIYCQCHQSVYDPFTLVKKNFTALPRPEDA